MKEEVATLETALALADILYGGDAVRLGLGTARRRPLAGLTGRGVEAAQVATG